MNGRPDSPAKAPVPPSSSRSSGAVPPPRPGGRLLRKRARHPPRPAPRLCSTLRPPRFPCARGRFSRLMIPAWCGTCARDRPRCSPCNAATAFRWDCGPSCARSTWGGAFGLKPSGPENEIRLIALAVADSVVVRYRLDDVSKTPLPVQQAKILARPINVWIEGLSAGVVQHIQPRSHTKLWIAPGEEISLGEAERASSHKGVVWVQLMDGNGRYVDICEIASPNGTAMVALSVHTWLREDGVKKLKGYATDIVLRLPGWSQRLEAFHDAVIESLSFGFCNAATTERACLDKRASQMTADTASGRSSSSFRCWTLILPTSPGSPSRMPCSSVAPWSARVLGLTMTPPRRPPQTHRRSAADGR